MSIDYRDRIYKNTVKWHGWPNACTAVSEGEKARTVPAERQRSHGLRQARESALDIAFYILSGYVLLNKLGFLVKIIGQYVIHTTHLTAFGLN